MRRLAGTGMAFPAARQAAAAALLEAQGRPDGAACLARPNDNLGIEYLRFLPAGWEAVTVRRQGVAHDGGAAAGFASASHLRQLLRAGEGGAAEPLSHTALAGKPGRREGGASAWCWTGCAPWRRGTGPSSPTAGPRGTARPRLVRCGRAAGTVEEFLTLAKTRRYTHARLRRLVTWAFLGLTARDRPGHVPYLRVLGFNDRGRGLLAEMKEKAALPILTKPAHARASPRRAGPSSRWRAGAPTGSDCAWRQSRPAGRSGGTARWSCGKGSAASFRRQKNRAAPRREQPDSACQRTPVLKPRGLAFYH